VVETRRTHVAFLMAAGYFAGFSLHRSVLWGFCVSIGCSVALFCDILGNPRLQKLGFIDLPSDLVCYSAAFLSVLLHWLLSMFGLALVLFYVWWKLPTLIERCCARPHTRTHTVVETAYLLLLIRWVVVLGCSCSAVK
jgi:hypothetical protein